MNNDINEFKKTILNNKIFITLYLFYSKNREFFLHTRIQKAYFLFYKEVFKKIFQNNEQTKLDFNENVENDFKPFYFGPYSEDVGKSLIFLEEKKIIIKSVYVMEKIPIHSLTDDNYQNKDKEIYINSNQDFEKKYFKYKLSDEKIDFIEKSKNEINENFPLLKQFDFWKKFEIFVDNMNKTDINLILKYVYKKYPDYIINSKIRKEVLIDE